MPKKDFKRELNKELMYQKIMPSSANISERPFETQAVEGMLRDDEEDISSSQDFLRESHIQAENTESSEKEDKAEPTHPIENHAINTAHIENRTPFINAAVTPSAAESVPPKFTDGPAIVNLMEYLVDQRVDDVLVKFNCCDCIKCRKDTIALALNRLPPKYVVVADEQAIDFTQHKAVAEILTALIQAVLTVRSNPRHDA